MKPEYSVMTGTMTAVVVYGIYQNALPSVADVRSLQANNADLAKSERAASWMSAAVVAGVALIAKDPTVFIIGGAAVVGMAWFHRHANAVHPTTGTTAIAMEPRVSQAEVPAAYSAPSAPTYEPSF